MHILEVIPVLRLAGAERMCETLSLELKKTGNKVTVISLFSEETAITKCLVKAGIEVLYLNKQKGLDLSIIKRLKEILKEKKPDIIHTHLNTLKYVALALGKKQDIPVVHTVHNMADKEVTKLDSAFHKWLFKKNKAYPVAISKVIKETIMKFYHLSDSQVEVIVNGVDVDQCIPKTEYTCKNGRFVFLHVARFAPQKNNFEVVKAFKELHDKNQNIELRLIGSGEEKIITEIKRYIKEYKLEQDVIIVGPKDRVYEEMNRADTFLLPSIYEGMPITIIEAMGTGLPIIATAVGGIPDLIQDHINGILIACNRQALVEAMDTCLHNLSLREQIGSKALLDSKKYTSKVMGESYLKKFKKIIDKNY